MQEVSCKKCLTTIKQRSKVARVFCSLRCQADYRQEEKVRSWLSGELAGWSGKTKQLRDFVRRHLHATRGTACSECGWDERHPVDGKILTEVDHVDGNAENCSPENLRILCPNCHSQTPTFRARNKGSCRKR